MKRTLGENRMRSEIARERRGGFGGCTDKLVYWKGGVKVLQPRWWRQRMRGGTKVEKGLCGRFQAISCYMM